MTLNAKATNPEHIDLSYDHENKVLSVYIIHGVSYPEEHYVNSVEVQVNGATVLTETYDIQEHYNIIHFLYDVDAEYTPDVTSGDTIRVIVRCNLDGIYYEDEHLYKTPKGHEYGFNTVPVPVLISTLIVVLILLLPKLLIKDKEKLVNK